MAGIRAFTCPECKGEGVKISHENVEKPGESQDMIVKVPCFFCDGTGYSTDEFGFEKFWESDEEF